MPKRCYSRKPLAALAGLAVLMTAIAARGQDDSSAGVVRISDSRLMAAEIPPRPLDLESAEDLQPISGSEVGFVRDRVVDYEGTGVTSDCTTCQGDAGPGCTTCDTSHAVCDHCMGPCRGGSKCCRFWQSKSNAYLRNNAMRSTKLHLWWHSLSMSHLRRNRAQSEHLDRYLLCKFGFLVPTGCGGAGCPPVGHYHMVYAVNPTYIDPRDTQVYAAQGYGIPMAVPLPPTVRHTYNYGWGVPSSRLTPVSTVAPY